MNLEDYYLKFVKRYLLFLFSLFMFYSIFILLYFKDIVISIFLIFLSLLYLLIISVEKITVLFIKHLKSMTLVSFLLLTFTTSFLFLYTYKRAGVEYFYLCLLFTIPLFFNLKKDFLLIFFISFIICINFSVCLFCDCGFIITSRFLKNYYDFKLLKLINFFFLLAIFFIDMLFISQKDILISSLKVSRQNMYSDLKMLTKANKKLNNQISNLAIKEDDFHGVYNLAKDNSPLFMDKFDALFPHFRSELLAICPSLIDSELHFCALIKLGLDGQKISMYTKSSIRAVDSRKYRIRKKLNIPPKTSLKEFIEELQNMASESVV